MEDMSQNSNLSQRSLSDDDLCSSILAKFEKLRLDDTFSTQDSEDEPRNRELVLKELVTQEMQHLEVIGDTCMESPEDRERKLNTIMQKYDLVLVLTEM